MDRRPRPSRSRSRAHAGQSAGALPEEGVCLVAQCPPKRRARPDNELPNRRQAGAHDADRDLDGRPNTHIVIVPRAVGSLGEGDEGLQTQDAHHRHAVVSRHSAAEPATRGGNNSQSADAEHESHADLLYPVYLQGAQVPERDDQDPDVKRDVSGRVRPGDGVGVEACSPVYPVPPRLEEVDRLTLKDGDEDKKSPPDTRQGKRPPE